MVLEITVRKKIPFISLYSDRCTRDKGKKENLSPFDVGSNELSKLFHTMKFVCVILFIVTCNAESIYEFDPWLLARAPTDATVTPPEIEVNVAFAVETVNCVISA